MSCSLSAIVLLLCCLGTRSNGSENSEESVPGFTMQYQPTAKLLLEILQHLKNGLDFMHGQRRIINLDGALGVRIAGDQLSAVIKQFGNRMAGNKTLEPILLVIAYLQNIADVTVNSSVGYLKESDSKYFGTLGLLLISGLWSDYYPIRTLPTDVPRMSSPIKPRVTLDLNEKMSDLCVSGLMGTSVNNRTKCNITDDCWSIMTSPDYIGYALTHEVFYLKIGTMFNCSGKMDEFVQKYHQGSLDNLIGRFCAAILKESREIVRNGYPEHLQDLFLEQIAFGGMLGYREFLNSDWILEMLSWQENNGCYTRPEFQSRRDAVQVSKREDKKLEGSCSAHKTAVAVGAMAVSVRLLVEGILNGITFSK